MITISLTYSQKGTIMDSLGRVVYEGEWHEDLQHGVGVYRYTYSLTHSYSFTHSPTHLGTPTTMYTRAHYYEVNVWDMESCWLVTVISTSATS